ncbi:MAG: LysM domain-containing protein [Halofilum sp. (in: g-proteobacteria)]|nr:LysM domain-containing protein [Halofilum sp. (in: g-proteobacteria)]
MTDRPSIDALRTALPALALALVAGCASQTPEPAPEPAAEPIRSEAEPAPETEPKVTREDVKPSHPVRYTVKRGDTLWDIAAMFLRDPWVWPEIWSVNPQIENPHLIYPGDIITLAFRDGEPRLVVERPGMPREDDGREKLEPEVRERSLDEAVSAIPADAIRQFLNRPRVVTEDELERAPYIVGNYEGRLISGEGNDVFARGFEGGAPDADRYNVYRPGDPLRDPDTGEVLGYEAIYVGKAAVRQGGDPARLRLTESTREILRGDRLMPADRQISRAEYIPQVPDERVDARIIQLFDAISQVATNQVVVLNHGETDGAEVTDVLAVMQSGGTVQDPYASDGATETVELPAQRVGTLMIFRTFDRVSYGLILDATQSIRLNDTATNP